MKLRTLFSLGAVVGITASAAASATLDSPNTFGIFALQDNTSTNLIISVPWVDCADASQATFVSNVVKTTNLNADDYLIVKKGDVYLSWQLTGTKPDLHWTAQSVVGTDSPGVTTTPDSNGERIARGMALWLHRTNPSTSSPIYLFGQYSTAAATTTITAGQTTMVANPGTSAMSPNSFNWTSGAPASGDKILVHNASNDGYKTYTFNGSKWTYMVKTVSSQMGNLPGRNKGSTGPAAYSYTETETDADPIPPGKGFWYQSKTGAGTITW